MVVDFGRGWTEEEEGEWAADGTWRRSLLDRPAAGRRGPFVKSRRAKGKKECNDLTFENIISLFVDRCCSGVGSKRHETERVVRARRITHTQIILFHVTEHARLFPYLLWFFFASNASSTGTNEQQHKTDRRDDPFFSHLRPCLPPPLPRPDCRHHRPACQCATQRSVQTIHSW